LKIKLYTGLGSGNSYKIDLMLKLLSVPYQAVNISIPKQEHKAPEFLAITPFGQIPVLVDDDQVFTDSQAILCYLARAYGGANADQWLPTEPGSLAAVVRWLSFAANEIQNGPTMARAIKLLGWAMDYDQAVSQSYRVLRILDDHLGKTNWLAADHATIADIAGYPYIFLAAEGGIDTMSFNNVMRWMRQLEALAGFWPMPRIPNLPPVPLAPVPD